MPAVPLTMRVALFQNHNAGEKSYSSGHVVALLRRAGYETRCFEYPDELDDPRALSAGEFIVIAGGDGSVGRALRRFDGCGVTLAFLPTGTANNIAETLGIRGSLEAIIRGWKKGARRPFDLGMIDGIPKPQTFVESVGVGLIARSIEIFHELYDGVDLRGEAREVRLRRDRLIVAALSHTVDPVTARVGGAKTSRRFLMLEAMNIPRAGPGIPISAKIKPTDGWLDLVRVGAAGREALEKTMKAPSVYGAKTQEPKHARFRRCVLELSPGPLRIDDVLVTLKRRTRIEFSIKRGAVKVLVPRL